MESSWYAVQEKHSLHKIEFNKYFKHIGRPFNDILTKIGINDNKNQIKKTYKFASLKNDKQIIYFNNAIKTLKDLKKNKFLLSIVTSKDFLRTKKFLNKNIKLFNFIECDDARSRGKPYPDKINKVISKCKVNKSDCVYIGDTNIDYKTASNAKIDFIFAMWGYGIKYNYQYKCNDISKIPELIDRL